MENLIIMNVLDDNMICINTFNNKIESYDYDVQCNKLNLKINEKIMDKINSLNLKFVNDSNKDSNKYSFTTKIHRYDHDNITLIKYNKIINSEKHKILQKYHHFDNIYLISFKINKTIHILADNYFNKGKEYHLIDLIKENYNCDNSENENVFFKFDFSKNKFLTYGKSRMFIHNWNNIYMTNLYKINIEQLIKFKKAFVINENSYFVIIEDISNKNIYLLNFDFGEKNEILMDKIREFLLKIECDNDKTICYIDAVYLEEFNKIIILYSINNDDNYIYTIYDTKTNKRLDYEFNYGKPWNIQIIDKNKILIQYNYDECNYIKIIDVVDNYDIKYYFDIFFQIV